MDKRKLVSMPIQFDMSVEEAMKLLNLTKNSTENELKINYKKIMMNIHPYLLGEEFMKLNRERLVFANNNK